MVQQRGGDAIHAERSGDGAAGKGSPVSSLHL